jgi:hypothetical protein
VASRLLDAEDVHLQGEQAVVADQRAQLEQPRRAERGGSLGVLGVGETAAAEQQPDGADNGRLIRVGKFQLRSGPKRGDLAFSQADPAGDSLMGSPFEGTAPVPGDGEELNAGLSDQRRCTPKSL